LPKLTTSLFEISSAAKTLIFSSSTSLKTYGIKKGDLISINGSTSDDGTYSITSVTDFEITIDSNNNFTGQTQSDNIKFYIYNNSVDMRDLAFESLSGSNKASLVEFYLKDDKSPIKTNILEYSPPVSSSNKSLIQIVDVKNNFENNGQIIFSKDSDDFLYVENDNNTLIKLPDDDSFYFNLKNELNSVEFKIFIEDSSSLKTYIQSNGNQTISYFLKNSLNNFDKIKLGSCLYENFRGRFAGSDHIRFNHGKNFGMIKEKDISDNFIEEYFSSFDYKQDQMA